MTVRVDYTQLDQPALTLSLYRTPSEWYGVVDQTGRVFFPPTQNIEVCLRFMAAMAAKGDATIDDASVEQATWHSVKVPGVLSEREAVSVAGSVPSRSESASNVLPFRKASA